MSSCEKPPRAVAGLNGFLADIEERFMIQQAAPPHPSQVHISPAAISSSDKATMLG